MKKILLMLLFLTFSISAYSQVAIVNGGNVKIFAVSTKDILKEIKKDPKVRELTIDVLTGYDKLTSPNIENYKAIVIINADLASGFKPEITNFIKTTPNKSKVMVVSWYKGYDLNTFTIEPADSSSLGVDATTSTTLNRKDSSGEWRPQFTMIFDAIKEFILARV